MVEKTVEYCVVYGEDLSGQLAAEVRGQQVLVVSDEQLWPRYGGALAALDPLVLMTRTMEEGVLEAENNALPAFDAAIGLGGGMALDIAKYHAWRRGKKLYQYPTAISVDAMFSFPIALRRGGKVVYTGEMFPEKIYCDYAVIRTAPPVLNRCGACDLLSCHTALYDWQLAAQYGGLAMDGKLFAQARAVLQEVIANAEAIYRVDNEAIKMIMEGFRFVAVENLRVGHCCFEEGSEHYFYYCLEALTGKQFMHGKVIGLGILLMSMLQDNEADTIKQVLKTIGVPIAPADMDITADDVGKALLASNSYVREKGYPYSILNHRPVTRQFVERALAVLNDEFGSAGR
ncbi:MAG: iron-containing alcohol dehydrogenase [Negativicutes bacterium]|nr:iron-containing alcohol dehydrogenase [Negativicutes bacterium]